jgi:hypothetical protein
MRARDFLFLIVTNLLMENILFGYDIIPFKIIIIVPHLKLMNNCLIDWKTGRNDKNFFYNYARGLNLSID